MDTKSFMNFIENLRYSRGMSQEEFLYDVISARQYQRYRNGTSEVSMVCIERISKKLGVETRKLLKDFESEKIKEKELTEEFYNCVVYKNPSRYKELLSFFAGYNFLEGTNYQLFQLGQHLREYLENNIVKQYFVSKIEYIIDYPRILSYDVLRDIEIIGLLLMYQHNEPERDSIIKLIKKLNDSQISFLSGQSHAIYVMFLYYIALDFGKEKNYGLVEKYCLNAIDLLKKKNSNYALYLFYYQLSGSYFYQGKNELFKDALYKCIIHTKAQFSDKLSKQMDEKIKKYYNIDAKSFILEYISTH
jgi:transcriptional regulator with XRE-family HTH domain